MRVTFVSYDDSPPLGGQGLMLQEYRAALQAHGVEVSTISGRGDHAVAFPRRTGRAPIDFSLYLRRHPDRITRDHPDAVHIFGGPGGVLFTRPLEVPLVYHAHHTYAQAYGRLQVRRALGGIEARAYRRASRVLAVSATTAAVVRAMGVPGDRVEVIPPGVDIHESSATQREPGRLLFVGRLEHEKGVLDALNVMSTLGASGRSVRGCVIGTGSLAGEVKRRAGSGPIEYLGNVDDGTLHREYARAALLLMPSKYEGLGRVALEAQAAQTPVVGYDIGGLRDAVQEGGVLVAAGDVTALGAACAALLDDAQRRAEMGNRGRAFVQAGYSRDRIVERLMEIYAEVVSAAT
jgi:glycosyltransferase involved in cell wall biosynthesis